MLMSKMQPHLKAIKTIFNTLKQLKILSYEIFNVMMNDIGMNNSFHICTYAECIKFHAISVCLK